MRLGGWPARTGGGPAVGTRRPDPPRREGRPHSCFCRWRRRRGDRPRRWWSRRAMHAGESSAVLDGLRRQQSGLPVPSEKWPKLSLMKAFTLSFPRCPLPRSLPDGHLRILGDSGDETAPIRPIAGPIRRKSFPTSENALGRRRQTCFAWGTVTISALREKEDPKSQITCSLSSLFFSEKKKRKKGNVLCFSLYKKKKNVPCFSLYFPQRLTQPEWHHSHSPIHYKQKKQVKDTFFEKKKKKTKKNRAYM